ncbi:MAG: helix-turn-helix domain-containing protein, partial [Candidatus Pelethousia sp.]|nr:helix-turn-helix domain-containing protein [Candidatus Pelethousia sp.]
MTKQAELKKQAYASSLKSRALSVLIYLIDRSNKDLTCFPAIPTMAEQLHISVSTVKRALKELVAASYLEKTARFRDKNRGQSSNLYTLLFMEQPPASAYDNTSEKEHRDDINTPDEEKQSKGHVVKHITFDTLAEKTKTEQKPSPSEIVQEDEIECSDCYDRPIRSVFCTPVQVAILSKDRKPRRMFDKCDFTILSLSIHPPF